MWTNVDIHCNNHPNTDPHRMLWGVQGNQQPVNSVEEYQSQSIQVCASVSFLNSTVVSTSPHPQIRTMWQGEWAAEWQKPRPGALLPTLIATPGNCGFSVCQAAPQAVVWFSTMIVCTGRARRWCRPSVTQGLSAGFPQDPSLLSSNGTFSLGHLVPAQPRWWSPNLNFQSRPISWALYLYPTTFWCHRHLKFNISSKKFQLYIPHRQIISHSGEEWYPWTTQPAGLREVL